MNTIIWKNKPRFHSYFWTKLHGCYGCFSSFSLTPPPPFLPPHFPLSFLAPPLIHCASSGATEPSLPSSPVLPSLFQSTCDTLRSHSDSLGFAPNVLPSHPTLGNFEEFACWRHRRRGQLAVRRQTVIPTCIHVHIYTRAQYVVTSSTG